MSENDIINFLKDQDGFVTTLKISKEMYGPEATKKQINSVLYSLLRKKKVLKDSDANGRNPRWKLSDNYNLEESILRLLSNSDHYVTTRDIVNEMGVDRKTVNSVLYALEKDGRIKKMTDENGTKPRWIVVG